MVLVVHEHYINVATSINFIERYFSVVVLDELCQTVSNSGSEYAHTPVLLFSFFSSKLPFLSSQMALPLLLGMEIFCVI